MSWLRRNWRWVLVFGVGLLGLIVVVILYALHKKREAEKLRDEIALMKLQAEVSGVLADRKARKVELENNSEARDAVNKEIRELKREAVVKVREVNGLSDIDVAMFYKRHLDR